MIRPRRPDPSRLDRHDAIRCSLPLGSLAWTVARERTISVSWARRRTFAPPPGFAAQVMAVLFPPVRSLEPLGGLDAVAVGEAIGLVGHADDGQQLGELR